MKHELLRTIERSETAYSLYKDDKIYFQALRIYNANKKVYHLLNEYLFECKAEDVQEVIEFIFHLEDWFNQFEKMRMKVDLNDEFVFNRLKNSIPYPKDFKKILS